MNAVRGAMGALLLLTAFWLISVLSGFGAVHAARAAAFLAILAGALLVRRKLLPGGGLALSARRRRAVNVAVVASLHVVGILLLAPALHAVPPSASAPEEGAFSVARVDSLRAAGRDVFVDFTASWCLTCKANEKLVLSDDRIRARFAAGRPVLLVADFTARSPEIAAELRRFGRAGVPLYVFYPASGAPVVLPEVLTAETVLSAFGAE